MPVTIQPSTTTATNAHYLPGTLVDGANALFRLAINWRVGGTDSGFIVQHVQRNEKYWVPGAGANAGQFYQAVCPFEYWEAWQISAPMGIVMVSPSAIVNGAVIHDVFAVNSLNRLRYRGMAIGTSVVFPNKPGTKGRWKIRGTVYHVPAAGFDLANWHRAKDMAGAATGNANAVDNAGKLLSRYDAPVRGNGLSATGVLGGKACTREFAGTWDWTGAIDPITLQRPAPTSVIRSYPWGGNFDSARRVFPDDAVTWVDVRGNA